MTLNNIIFIDSLPKLDLHGYDRQTATVAINDFINDQYKMGNQFAVIVHGIGSGIIRKTTQETLRKNKKIVDFKIYYYNSGCTLIQIVNDKSWQNECFVVI